MSEHGSYSRAQRHRKDGERPCSVCLAAEATYQRAWRADPQNRRQAMRQRRARRRALSALARTHPQEYRELYLTELARLRDEESPRWNPTT
ncbi:MAG: hypothetical protein ACRCZP_01965 [Phycicoccus sp.]